MKDKKGTAGSVVRTEQFAMATDGANSAGSVHGVAEVLPYQVCRAAEIVSECGSSGGWSRGIPYVSWLAKAVGAQ